MTYYITLRHKNNFDRNLLLRWCHLQIRGSHKSFSGRLARSSFGLFFLRHTKFRCKFVWPQGHLKVAPLAMRNFNEISYGAEKIGQTRPSKSSAEKLLCGGRFAGGNPLKPQIMNLAHFHPWYNGFFWPTFRMKQKFQRNFCFTLKWVWPLFEHWPYMTS